MQDIQQDSFNKIQQSLSGLIKIESIKSKVDRNSMKMYAMHEYLKMRFVNVFRKLEIININGSLLIKFAGDSEDNKPILLISYMQVNPPQGDWDRPYFSGEIKGGYIYGKGCINSKGNICALLSCVEDMIVNDEKPMNDTYILLLSSTSDIDKAHEHFLSSGIHFDYILDEGGAVVKGITRECKEPIALVAVGERKKIQMLLTSYSDENATAVERLSTLISKSKKMVFDKAIITDEFKLLIRHIISKMSISKKMVYNSKILTNTLVKKRSAKNRFFKRMLIPTVSFTMCDDAIREKYGECMIAEMGLSVGHNYKKAIDDFDRFAKKCGVNCKIILENKNSYKTNTNATSYKKLCKAIQQEFGGVKVFPFIKTEELDYSLLSDVCDNILRFKPFVLSLKEYVDKDIINECISVDNLQKAMNFYRYIIMEGNGNE